MFSFFSHFRVFFFFSFECFFHLSVTPTSCIGNDGKGWLCICICCCLTSKGAGDVNFKGFTPTVGWGSEKREVSWFCELRSSPLHLWGGAAAVCEGDFVSSTPCCVLQGSQCLLVHSQGTKKVSIPPVARLKGQHKAPQHLP